MRAAAQRVHGQNDLASAHTGADADAVKGLRILLHKGWERLLHADGTASTAQVAGQGQQILLRQHGDALASGGACHGLQVKLLFHWNDANQMRQVIACEHQRLVNHVRWQIDLRGDQLAVKIFVRDIILPRFVGNMACIQMTQDICFYLLGHGRKSLPSMLLKGQKARAT